MTDKQFRDLFVDREMTRSEDHAKNCLKQIRHALMQKYHPDKGGNADIAKGINLVYYELMKVL